eukprot:TRINITY_DN5841_c0_g2_i4.p1 TRINITY_DN5841_c0_g2~~TRINITY_DN5841_c0_g2_i4.p1  ORF type:complete len:824 (+),score=130.38 TRINITY_DN5841_c0_g2_i4:187-2658(+)
MLSSPASPSRAHGQWWVPQETTKRGTLRSEATPYYDSFSRHSEGSSLTAQQSEFLSRMKQAPSPILTRPANQSARPSTIVPRHIWANAADESPKKFEFVDDEDRVLQTVEAILQEEGSPLHESLSNLYDRRRAEAVRASNRLRILREQHEISIKHAFYLSDQLRYNYNLHYEAILFQNSTSTYSSQGVDRHKLNKLNLLEEQRRSILDEYIANTQSQLRQISDAIDLLQLKLQIESKAKFIQSFQQTMEIVEQALANRPPSGLDPSIADLSKRYSAPTLTSAPTEDYSKSTLKSTPKSTTTPSKKDGRRSQSANKTHERQKDQKSMESDKKQSRVLSHSTLKKDVVVEKVDRSTKGIRSSSTQTQRISQAPLTSPSQSGFQNRLHQSMESPKQVQISEGTSTRGLRSQDPGQDANRTKTHDDQKTLDATSLTNSGADDRDRVIRQLALGYLELDSNFHRLHLQHGHNLDQSHPSFQSPFPGRTIPVPGGDVLAKSAPLAVSTPVITRQHTQDHQSSANLSKKDSVDSSELLHRISETIKQEVGQLKKHIAPSSSGYEGKETGKDDLDDFEFVRPSKSIAGGANQDHNHSTRSSRNPFISSAPSSLSSSLNGTSLRNSGESALSKLDMMEQIITQKLAPSAKVAISPPENSGSGSSSSELRKILSSRLDLDRISASISDQSKSSASKSTNRVRISESHETFNPISSSFGQPSNISHAEHLLPQRTLSPSSRSRLQSAQLFSPFSSAIAKQNQSQGRIPEPSPMLSENRTTLSVPEPRQPPAPLSFSFSGRWEPDVFDRPALSPNSIERIYQSFEDTNKCSHSKH